MLRLKKIHILKNYYKGIFLYKKKEWKKALFYFQKNYNLDPQNANNTFKLGLCHLKLMQFQMAHLYLSESTSLSPKKTQWQVQLKQCNKRLNGICYVDNTIKDIPRISHINSSSLNFPLKKKLLLIPSDYNHRVMADISSFIEYYKENFNIYIILRELSSNIINKGAYTLVKNGTAYGEFLKFTADYVIDAGTINYFYRITDKNKWISVWHGIPYKKMFVDLDINNTAIALRYSIAYDYMISMSEFYTNIFLRQSMLYNGKILEVGCAKIDNLLTHITTNNAERINQLREQINIPFDKKVILYAPEYRLKETFNIPFDIDKLLISLGNEYCLLVFSTEIDTSIENQNNVFVVHHLNKTDALLIADIVISDYSNLIYEFDYYNKLVVLYHHDYEEFYQLNPSRHRELTILSKRYYVTKDHDQLLAQNWAMIQNHNNNYQLPEKLSLSYIKDHLGIPKNKKIILYAPTYRKAGKTTLPFDADKLLKYLGNDYLIITKMHYLNHLDKNYNHVIDCTSYSDMSDLMKIADILISDYSSLVLDFALLNKPIILFQYDYDEYMSKRGVYFDFNDYLPSTQILLREDELYHLDWKNLQNDNHKLIQKFYPLEDGNSTQRIVEAIDLDPSVRYSKDIIFLVNDLNQIGGVHSFIQNMAKYYKQKYNSRIYVIAIKEFAEANSQYYVFDSPYIDFKISSQYLNGACATILQNTDGIVISLQFSAHLHFQKYLTNANSILMFHGDVKDMISREIYGPHLDWLNQGTLYNYRRLLLLTQSAVDLLSPYLNQEVQNKLSFMHNSIDAEFTPIASHMPLHTAVISRLDPDKNTYALIELGKEILSRQENIVVNVYGDGSLKNELQKQIIDNKLENIIKLHGFEANKDKIFSQNDSLLLMSKSEGFGLVLLEAYSYAKPVIVFDSFTAAKELVKHQETGFLLPYGDYPSVIDAIKQLNTINQKEIAIFFKKFSNQSVFTQWDTLITKLDNE